MFELIVVIILFLIIIYLRKYIKITKKLFARLNDLEYHLTKITMETSETEKRLEKTIRTTSTPDQESTTKPIGGYPDKKKGIYPIESTPVNTYSTRLSTTASKEKRPHKQRSEFWIKVEKQFVENWTGILGAIIIVLGVSFFGIYAAVKLSPIFRFMMIVAFSGLLGGLFYYLKQKSKWLKLALWLRSSAGAIFLFACLGAGRITGLQWIENQLFALVLLSFSIFVNLYLGFIGGKQVFASLHILLSLIALSVAPQSNVTFIIAAIVSLFGIALTYREKWDSHLLLTISSFFLYHLFWYFKIDINGLTSVQNLSGIITVMIVSISTAFVHYREVYQTKSFAALPFTVHLTNWFYFALGLLLHSVGSKWKTIFIIIGSVAAFFLARKAKKIGILWLYRLDTLIAQFVAIIAIITLSKWEISWSTIMGFMFLQTLIYLIIMLKESDEFLYRIGTYIMHLIGLIFFLKVLESINYGDSVLLFSRSIILFISIVCSTVFHLYTLNQQSPQFNTVDYFVLADKKSNYSMLAILIGIMVIALFKILQVVPWNESIIILIAVPLVYLRQRFQSPGLGIGIVVLLLGLHTVYWKHLSTQNELSVFEKCAHSFPFLILSFSITYWSYVKSIKKHIKWIGIYLFVLHLMIATYFISNPISPLLSGIIWLILSMFALELSNIFQTKYKEKIKQYGEPDRFLLHVGYFLISSFLVRHIIVHLQVESYLWIINVRFLIELLAIAVFFYWATFKRPDNDKICKSWIYLHPLFIELILLFSILTISIEINEFWHPIVWICLAFVNLFISNKFRNSLSRLCFYSLILNWVAAFQVAFLTSNHVTPSMNWYDQAWLSGFIAILFQFCYLYYFYTHNNLKNSYFPQSIKFFQSWIQGINKRKNRWVFYPVIICVAIFLYWSFNNSIRTLLWAVECFAVFVLSIMLKENHFRHIALLGTILIVIRLIFYDLSQANTITRAFVFVGVGIIMLLINSAYNKYKDRFTHE